MADPHTFANDPAVNILNEKLDSIKTEKSQLEQELYAWLALDSALDHQHQNRDVGSMRQKISDLEKSLVKTKQNREAYIQRRRMNMSRSNPNPSPSSLRRTSNWDSTGYPERPDTAKREQRFKSETPFNSLGGLSSPDLGRIPTSNMAGSGHNPTTPHRSSIKRSFGNARGSLDPTSPAGRKRPALGEESPSFGSSPSASRAPSRADSVASNNSGIIDLTGDDDAVIASIDRHKKRAEETLSSREFPSSRRSTPQRHYNPSNRQLDLGSTSRSQQRPDPPTIAGPSRQQSHNYLGSTNLPPWSVHNSHAMQGPHGGFMPASQLPNLTHRQPSMPATAMPGTFPTEQNTVYISDSDDERSLLAHPYRRHQGIGLQPSQDLQLPHASGLASLIHRTNMYDFTTMTDGYGNPLDDRVATYARDLIDDPRKTKEEIDSLLQNITPDMDVPIESREGTPDGLRYPLYKHQTIALTWMKKQEQGTNKGGILADDMGLGKTISMLALMLSSRLATSASPTQTTALKKGARKTNLIVAPLSLVRQWEEEIKKKIKTRHAMTVYVFHGTQKLPASQLMSYDVVLTTYQTLLGDYNKLKKFWTEHEGRNVNTETDPNLAREVSLFHPKKSMFYRVILDESQIIKNVKSKTAQAAFELMADHRWCLSGTPMMNSVEELYPLFKFLKIKPYDSATKFKSSFGRLFGKRGDPKAQAMRNLQVILKATMLRRSKTSKIDNEPILTLPSRTTEVVHVTMEEEQLKFYQDLEQHARVVLNKYLREGTLGRHYSVMLVWLLRLRQSCCHPHLLLDAEESQPEVTEDMLDLARSLAPEVVHRILEKSRLMTTQAESAFECPICYDTLANPSIPLPCGHEICSGCLALHTANARRDNIRDGEESGQVKCAVCRGVLDTDRVVTYKAFKKIYMPEADDSEEEEEDLDDESSADSDEEGDDDVSADDADKQGNLKDFIVPDSEDDETPPFFESPSDDEDDDKANVSGTSSRQSSAKKKGKMPAKKDDKTKGGGKLKKKGPKVKASMLKSLRREAKKNADSNRRYRRYLVDHWLSSAKVDACVNLIRRIQHETDGEKTIVFSQWTMFLDLLEVALGRDQELKRLQTVRYDGEMSMAQRDLATKHFRDKDEVKVMFVSLRAGNAGLNLVSASRVIMMDPFWNPYIEAQAVDRAHRIGQRREVKVYQLLVKDTVEDRIIAIQEKKRAMVDAALDEGAAKKISGLSFQELKTLFAA